ncbi:MAG: polysaccharide biosynthesis/export family protein [Vicinamibacteria bacterium]
MKRKAIIAFLLAAAASTAAGAQEPDSQGDYRIGAGDTLNIVVWQNQELTLSVPVRPDGFISLPLMNEIKVEGLTPMQLQKAVTDRLTQYVTNPVVSVIVAQIGSFKVSVLGQVRNPSRYDLNGSASVLDVIAMAGGFGEFANKEEVFVLRPLTTTYQKIPFQYSQAISSAGKAVNFNVKPGDIIIVP